MPQKDDFLARLTAELTLELRDARSLKDAGRFAEALALLARAYPTHTGSDAALLRSLGASDLLALFSAGGTLNVERCLAVAELLGAETQVREVQGQARPDSERTKVLTLYLAAADAEPTLGDELGPKVLELQRGLQHDLQGELPAELLRQLFAFHAQAGRYAEAENWLYRLVEASPGDAGRARAFYEQLLTLPDELLAAGGLPRDEVQEGLAEVAERSQPL